jgi:hypothetical protein
MAAAASRVYSVRLSAVSISTGPITLIQIKAGATVPLQIIRSWVSQSSSTTSAALRVDISRKTAAATVTSATPEKLGPTTDPAASAVGGTAATGTNASGEGTTGNQIFEDGFNVLNGWVFLPTPKEYIFVDAATIVGLRFPVAPSATTFEAGIVFEELA